MPTCASLNFCGRDIKSNGLVIRAFEDHRINGIDDSKATRANGNIVGFEAARVTAAVEFLMMGIDEVGGCAQEFNAVEKFSSVFCMMPHDSPLLRIERAGFQ